MKYRVWMLDEESEARTYDKGAAWAAAESWAEDVAMEVDTAAVAVFVQAPDGKVSRWWVSGEMVPTYHVSMMHEDEVYR